MHYLIIDSEDRAAVKSQERWCIFMNSTAMVIWRSDHAVDRSRRCEYEYQLDLLALMEYRQHLWLTLSWSSANVQISSAIGAASYLWNSCHFPRWLHWWYGCPTREECVFATQVAMCMRIVDSGVVVFKRNLLSFAPSGPDSVTSSRNSVKEKIHGFLIWHTQWHIKGSVGTPSDDTLTFQLFQDALVSLIRSW